MRTIEFSGDTASQLYEEGLYKFRSCGVMERTRNGPALVMPGLTIFTLNQPRCRVIDDPIRRANPFFHVMEFVWMMAGRSDAAWISQYNPRMETYADSGHLQAAYGVRARLAFGFDQFLASINMLKADNMSRQVVVQLWNPIQDVLRNYKDKACNTELMFRHIQGRLDCTVINRSNDFVWGALGANICHLTMFHEMVAHFAGIPLGEYTVVSNNLHMYTGMPRYEEHSKQLIVQDVYKKCYSEYLFDPKDTYEAFVKDCDDFTKGNTMGFKTRWVAEVAMPIRRAWEAFHSNSEVEIHLDLIKAEDWRIACRHWVERKMEKISSSVTSTEPSP